MELQTTAACKVDQFGSEIVIHRSPLIKTMAFDEQIQIINVNHCILRFESCWPNHVWINGHIPSRNTKLKQKNRFIIS